MRTIPMFIVALCITSLGWMGCSNDKAATTKASVQVNDVRAQRLASSMLEIMDNKTDEFESTGFVVHDPKSDSLIVCNDEAYVMGTLMGSVMNASNKVADVDSISWVEAGTCQKADVPKLAQKLSQQLPADAPYQIMIERQIDNSYQVRYLVLE